MNDQKLLDRGYHKFKPTPFDDESVVACFQTSFCDENDDRKYFLTWKKWDFSRFASPLRNRHLYEPSYEATTQLTYKKNGQSINIDFLNGWEPEDAEAFLDDLFKTGWFEKYD